MLGCLNVPQCAIAFKKLFADAGAPDGLYTNHLISHDQSNKLIDDPRIKGVALTGSVPAGRSIAARAGQNLKPSSMELGGSDAFIVLEDADLDHTVKWAVWGRMYNDGQTCCAAKRFIVVDKIAEAFLAKLQEALSALKAGDPMDEKTTLGPLSTETALVDLLKQVGTAVAHGAKIIMGGRRIDRPGAFMQPTILSDVQPSNPAFRDEFFGPVAMFFRVKDEAAAIALANDSAADLIITTAAIPGRPSPKLISTTQVAGMKAGAVIVDLSAEGGGNCEDTRPGETVAVGCVTIVAPLNVSSLLGEDASAIYAKNQYNLLLLMMKYNIVTIDWSDEILASLILDPPEPKHVSPTTAGEQQ